MRVLETRPISANPPSPHTQDVKRLGHAGSKRALRKDIKAELDGETSEAAPELVPVPDEYIPCLALLIHCGSTSTSRAAI